MGIGTLEAATSQTLQWWWSPPPKIVTAQMIRQHVLNSWRWLVSVFSVVIGVPSRYLILPELYHPLSIRSTTFPPTAKEKMVLGICWCETKK